MNLGLIILFNYIIKKYKTRFNQLISFNYIIKNNNISKWIEFFLKKKYDDIQKKILVNKKNYENTEQ
jgi:hypothetical protein